jgi:uncharacterized protein (TIGR02058 family)
VSALLWFIRLIKGFGADAHGQNSTKAASTFRFASFRSVHLMFTPDAESYRLESHPRDDSVRACRNAIEFNQIPSIADIVPGGRDGMKLDVLLAVPPQYQNDLDLEAIRKCFPYGQVRIQIQTGGMVASSGKIIESLGDRNDDMVVVCVAVTVGY